MCRTHSGPAPRRPPEPGSTGNDDRRSRPRQWQSTKAQMLTNPWRFRIACGVVAADRTAANE